MTDKDKEFNLLDDELMTKDDVVKFLQVSHSKLNQMIRDQEIPYIKLGRKVRFLKSDLIA